MHVAHGRRPSGRQLVPLLLKAVLRLLRDPEVLYVRGPEPREDASVDEEERHNYRAERRVGDQRWPRFAGWRQEP